MAMAKARLSIFKSLINHHRSLERGIAAANLVLSLFLVMHTIAYPEPELYCLQAEAALLHEDFYYPCSTELLDTLEDTAYSVPDTP
jgi:hypothetical protein